MGSMFDDKLAQLIDVLERATGEGRIRWEETDRPSAYMAAVRDQKVVIASKDDDGQEPYELAVYSSSGRLIESFHSDDEGHHGAMGSLHITARRNSQGVQKVIDNLIEYLEPPPF